MQTILTCLETAARRCPHKTAFIGESGSMTYREIWDQARAVGSYLLSRKITEKPLAVAMEPSPRAFTAILGVLYSGNFCLLPDRSLSRGKLGEWFQEWEPAAVLCAGKAPTFVPPALRERGVDYEKAAFGVIREELLLECRERMLDLDAAVVEGGFLLSHRCVLDRTESLCDRLPFGEEAVFGSLGSRELCFPELFACLKLGAVLHILPEGLGKFPVQLVEYLNKQEINTLLWDTQSMANLSAPGTFGKIRPRFLRTVAFAGESLPVRELSRWRRAIPRAGLFRLWGDPAVGLCCFHEIRETEMAPQPLGRPFPNTQAVLLDKTGRPGEKGRLYIRGVRLGQPLEHTDAPFRADPRPFCHSPLYDTGLNAHINEQSELVVDITSDS